MSEVYVFACQHRIPEDWRPPLTPSELKGRKVRIIQLPCSAKLSTVHMLRPFEKGIDSVLVMMCEENGCRSLEGSRRARIRVREANNILDEIGLGSKRVLIGQTSGKDKDPFLDMLDKVEPPESK